MSELDLGPLAIEVANWLSQNSPNGLSEPIGGEEITKQFSEPAGDIKEALAELELEGLVGLTKFIGRGIPHVRPNVMLFVEFDPEVMGTDPVTDASHLAGLALQGGESVHASQLHQQSGWDKRRFNPALSVLLSYVDDRHVSKTLQAEYPTQQFFLDATDRVELKRFIRDVSQ